MNLEMNQQSHHQPRRLSRCCQRRDGLLKARFDTLEHAQQVAAAAKDVTLRPYECTRIRGTYHLTSKPLRQEQTE